MTEAQISSKTLAAILGAEASRAEKQLGQTDLEDIIKNAEFLKKLFPSWVFILCKVQPYQFSYVSDNCQDILGYTAHHLQKLSLEQYFTLVHPEDAKAVRLCFDYVRDQIKSTAWLDFVEYRFIFHYRLRTQWQQYVYVLDEKHALQNEVGKYLQFTLLKNVTQLEPFTHAKVEIYKRINGDYRNIDTYVPRIANTYPITSREKEILQCIQEGLTSKQIAEKLSISVCTVRNHRSRIFLKAGADNVIQVLKYAKTAGWI